MINWLKKLLERFKGLFDDGMVDVQCIDRKTRQIIDTRRIVPVHHWHKPIADELGMNVGAVRKKGAGFVVYLERKP